MLIADQYHHVVYSREMNLRKLIASPSLEHHIEYLTRDAIPPAEASFNTREEAEAWFENQREPSHQFFILIAGKYHLAVYYRDINHRAIYPTSIIQKLEQEEETGKREPRS